MPKDYASQSHQAVGKACGEQLTGPIRQWLRRRGGLLILLTIVIMVAVIGYQHYQRRGLPALVREHAARPSPINIIFHSVKQSTLTQSPRYYELLAAMTTHRNQASRLQDQLYQLGFKTTVQPVRFAGQQSYQVLLGPFADQEDAAQRQTALQRHNQISVIRAMY